MNLTLDQADRYAAAIAASVEPFCDRIQVAGSIRRRRQVVHDIDFVVMTRQKDEFKKRCREKCYLVQDGQLNFRIEHMTKRIQIEFYFAEPHRRDLFQTFPSNWGSILLCRTGSKEHNIYLAKRAKAMGLHWYTYKGLTDSQGDLIASETEEAIFEALAMPFLNPEERELDPHVGTTNQGASDV